MLTIGIVEIAFRARLQFDHEATDESIELEEDVNRGLDLSRRRIGIAGQVRGYAEFQVEYDLQDDEDPWRDVYVNYSQFDEVQFQLGKFKLPFSLDENTSATNLDFVYRSLAASTLAPGRDIGWMVHGRVVKSILRYEFGSFEHDGAQRAAEELHARVRRPHRGGPDRRAAVPPVGDGGGGSARRRRLDVERCARGLLGAARRNGPRAAVLLVGVLRRGRAEAARLRDAVAARPVQREGRVHEGRRTSGSARASRTPTCRRCARGAGTSAARGRSRARKRPTGSTRRSGRCSRAGSAPSRWARASRKLTFDSARDRRTAVNEPARRRDPRQQQQGAHVRRELVRQPLGESAVQRASRRRWPIPRRVRRRR